MSSIFEVTGGARFGRMNASWPLGKLRVSAQELTVEAKLLGTYTFTQDQVVAMSSYGWIPVVYRGVRIEHVRADCPELVVFWCFGSPAALLERISSAGFTPTAQPTSVPHRTGTPLRWQTIVLGVVLWNALFLLDGFVPWNQPKLPGPYVWTAVATAFASSWGLLKSDRLQNLALQPDRSIGEIAPFLSILRAVSGVMLVAITAIIAFGH